MNAGGQRGALKRVGGQWVQMGGDSNTAVMDQEPETVEQSNGDGEMSKPWKTATRAEWDDYARSQGLDPDEFKSKEDLIKAVG